MNWFRNLRIKRKLTFVLLFSTGLSLLLACSAFVAYEMISYSDTMRRDLTVLADVLGQNTTAALKFDDPTSAENTLRGLHFEPNVAAACLFKGRTVRVAGYLRAGTVLELPSRAGPEGCRIEGDYMYMNRPVILNGEQIGTIYLQADLQGIKQRVRLYAGIAGLVLIGSWLFTLLLLPSLYRGISDPIVNLERTARAVSEKKDYSVRAEKRGQDEIGRLTDAFNQMLGEIETGQGALQKAHQSLLLQTGQIMDSVSVLSTSVKQILDFSTQVATSATETATVVNQTTATVEEARQTAQMSAQMARSVADASHKAQQTSQAGKKSAEDAADGMHRIRQQMDSIADSMARLSAQSQAIGQIIATVDDLAAQSNLLAVNAAIEAAKAGEQGKGFAVVAQEIKNLAEQSKQATNQVRGILSDIQKATGAAAMATEQGSHAVENGVRQSKEAGDSILTLTTNVAEAARASIQISASSQQQAAGMDQIASAMISVKQATLQNVASAHDLEAAAHRLNDLGQKLAELVQEYKA